MKAAEGGEGLPKRRWRTPRAEGAGDRQKTRGGHPGRPRPAPSAKADAEIAKRGLRRRA